MKVRDANQAPGTGVDMMKADAPPEEPAQPETSETIALTKDQLESLMQMEIAKALDGFKKSFDPQDHIAKSEYGVDDLQAGVPPVDVPQMTAEELKEMDLTPVEVTVAPDPLQAEMYSPIWVQTRLHLVPRGVKTRVPFNVCLAIAEAWDPKYQDAGRDPSRNPKDYSGNLHRLVMRPASRMPINLHNGTEKMHMRLMEAMNTIPSPGEAPPIEAPMLD